MKKVLTLVLTVVMALSLAITAFAASGSLSAPDTTGTGTTDTGNVTASYTPSPIGDVAKAYYVNISWKISSSLTYKDGEKTLTWNATSMEYEDGGKAAGSWDGTASVEVTITNQSNDQISAKAEWKDNGDDSVTTSMTFTDSGTVTVEDASNGVSLEAGQTGSVKTKTITGTMAASAVSGAIESSDAVLGHVTVTFNPVAA